MDLPEPSFPVQGAVRALLVRMMASGWTATALDRQLGWAASDAAQHPLQRVGLRQWDRLCQLAADTLKRPAIAVELPLDHRNHPAHLLVHLAMSAETVQGGLRAWAQFASLHGDMDRVDIRLSGKLVHLSYAMLDVRFRSRWISEYMVARLWSLVHALSDSRMLPQGILFSHTPPAHALAIEAAFRAPVRYAADEDAVVFDVALLDRKVHGADLYLHEILTDTARRLHLAQTEAMPLEQRLVQAISARLLAGRDCNAPVVAEDLGLTLRQMRAALGAAGSSFRAVFDEVRRSAAVSYLSEGLDNARLAERLGFSESSALQHAFRRWYGTSVGAFTARLADGAAGPAQDSSTA
jgi:AraC-like DNA-binding protein